MFSYPAVCLNTRGFPIFFTFLFWIAVILHKIKIVIMTKKIKSGFTNFHSTRGLWCCLPGAKYHMGGNDELYQNLTSKQYVK